MAPNFTKITFFSAFILTIMSCSFVPPTTSDYDVNYNFSKLKSYAWITKRTNSGATNPKQEVDTQVLTLRERRQISAVESVLAKKGFIKSDSLENADFLIKSHNVTDKKKDVRVFYSIWGYYPYYHSPYILPHRVTNSVEREYEVGTQVLDIVDAKSREVIWRGSVSQRLGFYKNHTPEQRNQRILINVDLMLKSFPPETVQ